MALRNLSIVAASAVIFSAAALSNAAIVVNGGFETAGTGPTDALAWDGENGATITRLPVGGVGGTAGALVSNILPASAAGPFTQFTTTSNGGDVPVAGTVYTFSFANQRTFNAGGVFQALVNFRGAGNTPLGQALNTTLTSPTTGFVTESFVLPAAPAGIQSFEIQFFAITGGATGTSSSVILDNVSIGTAVPEPTSLSLLGLGGLALLRRKRA